MLWTAEKRKITVKIAVKKLNNCLIVVNST